MTILKGTIWTLVLTFVFSSSALPAELITNGSFETGNHTGWTTQIAGSNYWTWAVTPAGGGISEVGVTTSSPLSGSFSSHGDFCCNTGVEYIQQDVTLPAAQTAQLKWSDKIQSNLQTYCTVPACGSNVWRVQILNTSNVVLQTIYTFTATGGSMHNTGWVNHVFTLNAFAGQTIRIRFSATYTSSIGLNMNGPGRNELDAVSVTSPAIPTATSTSISGRITSFNGRALPKAEVTLTDGAGRPVRVITNPFGYYSFEGLTAGSTYLVAVTSKGYLFPDSPRLVTVTDLAQGIDFQAAP